MAARGRAPTRSPVDYGAWLTRFYQNRHQGLANFGAAASCFCCSYHGSVRRTAAVTN